MAPRALAPQPGAARPLARRDRAGAGRRMNEAARPPIPRDPPARRPHPSRLFVEVTTRCNLRCAMCVKESAAQGISEGHLRRETFARLAPAFPHLDALVLNGVGEPLLHPRLEEF